MVIISGMGGVFTRLLGVGWVVGVGFTWVMVWGDHLGCVVGYWFVIGRWLLYGFG